MDTLTIALDVGASAFKLSSQYGDTMTYARVSVARPAHKQLGKALDDQSEYVEVKIDSCFCVGRDAHNVGIPIENVGNSRLEDSPTTRAIYYAALSKHLSILPSIPKKLNVKLTVGLPLSIWAGGDKNIVKWVDGTHIFSVREGKSAPKQYNIQVQRKMLIPQAAGALYDWAIDDEEVRDEFRTAVIGVISIGMNTTEIMISEGGRQTPVSSASLPIGVKDYISLYADIPYSLGQLDQKIRDGTFHHYQDLHMAWVSNLIGAIYKIWGDMASRIDYYILTGGGASLLFRDGVPMPTVENFLLSHGQRYEIRDIHSIARGLLKITNISERSK